ncbi:hypothetical protein TorRG33x02_335700 [Trema orientale]|uniref:Uncharacterized protein n=1 Tax=Trema orientale TaxID=63057 RepID=A0A2P5B121_TREOI|nr:hypothetical protein TorRG33x02_335700 [Trema orientale]
MYQQHQEHEKWRGQVAQYLKTAIEMPDRSKEMPPVEKRSEQPREVVQSRSKFSTGGFDPSRIVRLRSNGGSTPVEHFRLESKFSGHWLKNDRNNRERWSDKFDYGRKFSTLVEWRRRRRSRDRDRWWWLK